MVKETNITVNSRIENYHKPKVAWKRVSDSDMILPKVAWKRVSDSDMILKYTEPVSAKITALRYKYGLTSDNTRLELHNIDKFIGELIHILLSTSNDLPQTRYKKYLKPYWNEQLKADHATMERVDIARKTQVRQQRHL